MQTIGSIEVLSKDSMLRTRWHGQHHVRFTKGTRLFWETCPAVLQTTRLAGTTRSGTANEHGSPSAVETRCRLHVEQSAGIDDGRCRLNISSERGHDG